jgi:hypothetical protein
MSTKKKKRKHKQKKKKTKVPEMPKLFFKKRRITKQVRVGLDSHTKLQKLAKSEKSTMSQMIDEIILSSHLITNQE